MDKHQSCKKDENWHKSLFGPKNITVIKGSCQKKRFFWDIFPKCGWLGWLIPKQGPNPSKPPQITPKNRLFRPEFHLSFSQISQKPWGGWVSKQIWERSPKKSFFWGDLSQICLLIHPTPDPGAPGYVRYG